jgi:hypothetical protein
MEIAFGHPFGGAPRSAIGGRVVRSTVVVGAVAFLVVRAGLGSLAGPAGARGFETRPVSVTTRDTRPMFSLPGLVPGQAVTRDATIAEAGPASDLRLFAGVTDGGLARSLTLIVTVGRGRGDAFVPDEGAGTDGGVVYRGPLASFPASWTDGISVGSTGTPTFRFRVSLPERVSRQGATAGASFVWEARAD